MNKWRRNCQKKILSISLCAQTSEQTREREIYYCHDPYLISSNREQMGICLVHENEIIFLLNYFIIIWIIIFKKKS